MPTISPPRTASVDAAHGGIAVVVVGGEIAHLEADRARRRGGAAGHAVDLLVADHHLRHVVRRQAGDGRRRR